jgi:glutamate/tyrosine decarboxylase-like PLP-dependent enzyme
MDLEQLEKTLESGRVGTVVMTVGTTGVGSLDPLPEVLELQKRYGFRTHIDSAYGGYFTLLDNLSEYGRKVYDCFPLADSIVVDPHKHGLQPYGCGCVLFKDPEVGRFYKHDSPYTYFSSTDLHLGEISLECSRAGANAAALWATQKLLPLEKGGAFARDLAQSRSAALDLYRRIVEDQRFLTLFEPETDIVVWAPKGNKASEISNLSQTIFDKAAKNNLHLAVFNFPTKLLKENWTHVEMDAENVACLRSCLMKPEHNEWMEQIWQVLSAVTDDTTKEMAGE